MPAFRSDGILIHYEVFGEGRPVLLIHGFASNIAVNWVQTGWVDVLNGAGFQVIAFDNRGHGESQKLYDPQLYFAHEMAGDALRLLDHLSLDRVSVLGFSMGARIAAFFALQHPERVEQLVLGGMGRNLVDGLANSEEIISALTAESLSQVTGKTGRQFRIFADHSGADRAALSACMINSREPMVEDDVRRIATPTLVAVGEADDMAGPPEALVELLPNAEAFIIPRRDHLRSTGDIEFKKAAIAFLQRQPI